MVKIHLQRRRPQFDSWAGKIHWRRDRVPIPIVWGFPGGSDGKESACSAGELGSFHGLGRSPGEGDSSPLQCPGLENPRDSTAHGGAKSQARLSDFHSTSRLFCCRAQVPGTKASAVAGTGFSCSMHVEYPQTREQTHAPCIAFLLTTDP